MKMQHPYITLLAIIAGFGLGAFVVTGLRSENAAPAYFVTLFDTALESEMTSTNYPSLAPATFQPFGGHYLIHSGRTIRFDGQPPKQIVVIAFDSMERLQAWHSSEAFKQLYDVYKIAKVKAFAVEGVAPGTVSLDSTRSGY